MTASTDLVRAAQEAGLNLVSQSQERLAPETRALHRRVLQAFLDTGAAPALGWLHDQATHLGLDSEAALRALAEEDLVHLANGSVVVAYPFSGVPANDSVQLEEGPLLNAMCAIDALGIPLMTGRDGVISSTEPRTGEVIWIRRNGTDWEWSPASTVVVAGFTASLLDRSRGLLSARGLLRQRRRSRRVLWSAPRAQRCGPRS